MKRRAHLISPFTAYTDVLFSTLGAVLFLLAVFAIMVNPPVSGSKAPPPKAEFLVTLNWDKNRDVDLDLWLEQDDCVVYYHVRECPNISIDRDSLGFSSNRKKLPDGSFAVSDNQEIIAIRAIMPGDYIAAVSYFAGKDEYGATYPPLMATVEAAIDATVELTKINPAVQSLVKTTLHLVKVKETQNAIAFHINPDGTAEIQELPPTDMISRHQSIKHGP
jgi:hypothetical protein